MRKQNVMPRLSVVGFRACIDTIPQGLPVVKVLSGVTSMAGALAGMR
jgi:hypothetical protein